MNPEWKSKWIEALRSGEYPQTHDCLKDNIGYCCLGVLCDISKAGQWIGTSESKIYSDDGKQFGSWSAIPIFLLKVVGLESTDPQTSVRADDGSGRKYRLSELNDTLRWDFNRIAEVIEREL